MKIIAAGTFDHLHEGHTYFLEEAFKRGFVLIGLCADEMLSHKQFSERIHPYERRKNDLTAYLDSKEYEEGKDYIVEKIEDKYGFAITVEDIDAILVTPEVRKNAEEINETRRAKGWSELDIIEIPLLQDEDGVISSTRMRQSE